jgi:hypothetical protein
MQLFIAFLYNIYDTLQMPMIKLLLSATLVLLQVSCVNTLSGTKKRVYRCHHWITGYTAHYKKVRNTAIPTLRVYILTLHFNNLFTQQRVLLLGEKCRPPTFS